MARLLIIAIIAFLVYVALRGFLAKKQLSVRQFMNIYLATMAGLLLLFLAFTGRLHPLFALVGAVLPFVFRIMGLIMQGAQFAAILKAMNINLGGRGPSAAPSKSEIKSRYIHMVLFHDSGMMEGTVLEGQFAGSSLSDLSQEQLSDLLKEVASDADSYNLLAAYLEREYEDFSGGGEQASHASTDSGEMTEAQALDILGLEAGANAADVKDAHRRMMQKVHPDRGGSTYLATKINGAKDYLLKLYE